MNQISEYIKLEQRLTLLAWLNHLFGYQSNRELLQDIKEAGEGFDSSGRSYISLRLESRGTQVKIPTADLERYDDNIRSHLAAMNAARRPPITLRYFQYLAVLYAELFLDWKFSHPHQLLGSLNEFVHQRNAAKAPGELRDEMLAEADLNKLAFWMATGSGKTLIMHFNYRQFLHYNTKALDNILLITPNEGLSEQHLAEMSASGIPCQRFDLNESGLAFHGRDVVRVIEITKLVEEKRGGGLSVPVEAFEGNNLIFVDEGHKGSGGEAWRRYRDALAETGFTFEYSATFGQALTASRNDRLTAEYGKAIGFDYSYRYFHGDGYGKDFRILNLREETTEDKTEVLLLGNLLSFYEQQLVFKEQAEALKRYHLDKPLWVFVGSSVNAIYSEEKQKRSDVLTIARFLHHLLENQSGWVTTTIEKILAGKTGLVTPDDRDIFEGKFEYLRQTHQSPLAIFQDLLVSVFHSQTGGGLHLCDLRSSAGELGLKVSGADHYFGLIYIGDTSSFKKLVEEDGSGIVQEEDAITSSLFEGISEPNTPINILIGAKKFMEGWNSWRVSNMGLLNIGRREGSEIIQLFGRGVRLRGKNLSLKRSSALDGNHPQQVSLLETLNIFAVRANYMAQFRAYLEREGVETEDDVVLPLAIKPNETFLKQGLVVPRLPEGRHFVNEVNLLLEPDPSVQARVDLSLKVDTMELGKAGLLEARAQAGRERPIPSESLQWLDWEKAYLDLITYKQRKGMTNLVIRPDVLKKILTTSEPNRLYHLIADESLVKPSSFSDVFRLQNAVQMILRTYLDEFYKVRRQRWESEHLEFRLLDQNDDNFQHYKICISRSEKQLIEAVHKLIEEADQIYKADVRDLPNIHFDRHLYQPLLVAKGDKIRPEPPGLEDSEWRFVDDLRTYYKTEEKRSLAKKEIFLLRNLSRGKGIGFFSQQGFYPDFILWIKQDDQQRIIFIEPHGMLMAKAYIHDDKAKLHETLSKLKTEIAARSNFKNVMLDSFIISATPFEELRLHYDDGTWDMNRFAENHIIFPIRDRRYDYIAAIIG